MARARSPLRDAAGGAGGAGAAPVEVMKAEERKVRGEFNGWFFGWFFDLHDLANKLINQPLTINHELH